MLDKTNILGVNIISNKKREIINYIHRNFNCLRGKYICLTNTHALVTAVENKEFMKIQNSSALSLPDGAPLAKYINKNTDKNTERYSGPEFLKDILELANSNKYKIFVYGNTDISLKKFKEKLLQDYPNINYHPFEKSKFRDLEDFEKSQLIKSININQIDIVLVSLGCPKQERFCYELANKTSSLWIAVGGAINVYSGEIPRAPIWMQEHCLEWLYRLLKEPRRLFKRYFIYNIKYIYYIFRENKNV